MGADQKRQLKKEKIISILEEAKYSVVDWFLNSNNSVFAFLVRNNVNFIDFICYLPDNVLLTVDGGQYCSKTSSPDFDQSIQMWNEITLDHIAIKVFNGIIFRKENVWESYLLSPDKKAPNDLDEIASTFVGLDESNVKIVTSNPAVEIIGEQVNPFDIILDGGEIKQKNVSTRIEECQPNMLVNYKGFTYGQAIPFINFKTFTNELSTFDVKLAKMNKDILQYQTAKIKTCANEAISLLTKFKDSLEKSVKEWDDQWTSSSELLGRVQSILEKSHSKKGDDFQNKANSALKETTEQIIQKRDALIGILMTCKELFHQV